MLLATAFLPVPHVNTGVSLLEQGTTEQITTWKVGIIGSTEKRVKVITAPDRHPIQQVLSGNATVGDLRRVNKVYAQKQRQVA
ncbi:hypothetical protein T05_6607, partial [Trichinella murrelli]